MTDTPTTEPPESEPKGLECPKCGCRHFRVTDTRKSLNGKIRRRRVCRHCDRPMYTFEVPAAELAKRKT